MRRRLGRGAVLLCVTLGALLLLTGVAQAKTIDAGPSAPSNGNTLWVSIIQSNGTIYCGGRDQHSPLSSKLLVSYTCQYQDNVGHWIDFYTASAYSAKTTDTGWRYMSYTIDYCFYLRAGTWKVRGESDGYWVDANSVKHEYSGTFHTAALTVKCT